MCGKHVTRGNTYHCDSGNIFLEFSGLDRLKKNSERCVLKLPITESNGWMMLDIRIYADDN